MSAANTVLFRADGSYELGMGHIMRCLALSDFFAEAGWKTVFACKPDLANPKVLEGQQIEFVTSGESVAEAARKHDADLIVVDMSHRYNAQAPQAFAAQCMDMRQAGSYFAVIDGNADECISSKTNLFADVVVLPYVGAEGREFKNVPKVLAGTKYAIFQREYARRAPIKRVVKDTVEKTLVTMGGSDPFGLTELTLKALAACRLADVTVTVVMGPGFSEKTKVACEQAAAASSGSIKLLAAPAGLAEELLGTDLAIINDGLTKYEAAVTGTPAIVLSFDEHQRSLSKDFSELGCYAPFGPEKIEDSQELARFINQVSRDASQRKRMSEIGRREFDPRGGARVVQEIEKELRNGK